MTDDPIKIVPAPQHVDAPLQAEANRANTTLKGGNTSRGQKFPVRDSIKFGSANGHKCKFKRGAKTGDGMGQMGSEGPMRRESGPLSSRKKKAKYKKKEVLKKI